MIRVYWCICLFNWKRYCGFVFIFSERIFYVVWRSGTDPIMTPHIAFCISNLCILPQYGYNQILS